MAKASGDHMARGRAARAHGRWRTRTDTPAHARMPYLACPTCDLTVYSAAKVSTVDDCPRCGTTLGRTGSSVLTPVPHTLRLEPGWPRKIRPRQSPGAADAEPGEGL